MAARKESVAGAIIAGCGMGAWVYAFALGNTIIAIIGAALLVIGHQAAHHRELVQIRKALEQLSEEGD